MHFGQARQSFLAGMPPGQAGTVQTLRMMRALVGQYKRAGDIRENTLALIAGLPPKDWAGEVNAVFSFVRDHIRYVRDIHGVETLQTPLVTLDVQAGDCDDKSTLLATMLASIGHPTRFVAVGYEKPGSYSHVYVETRIGTRWIPLDATVLQPMGWTPRQPAARLVISN
jgi:transglutaminase-like putative cysteine protease